MVRKLFQICWVVRDLYAAMPRFQATFDTGPFYTMEDIVPDEVTYRGSPGEQRMHAAFAQSGDLQVELIQPLSTSPNVYDDSLPNGAEGFHHVCYWAPDLAVEKARFAAQGAVAACEARAGDQLFAYFDTRHLTGSMTEVLQNCEATMAMFDAIRDAAKDWDGRDPIRSVNDLF